MAVSKRLRYEVLRRDNHACRYCGAVAPDVVLTVDHVVPVALGGTDLPDNLVTACADCNAGKSASSPDAALVDDVAQDALRWGRAMQKAAALDRQDWARARALGDNLVGAFQDVWEGHFSRRCGDPELRSTLVQMYNAGALGEDVVTGVEAARAGYVEDPFRYFCGVVWRRVQQRQERARTLFQEGGD